MQRWEKDRFAETAYKRLYWQGYRGRFGIFRWPTGNGFDATFSEILLDSRNYDNSEFTAWQSSVGLTNLLTTLDGEYPGHVYVMAHSMGNIVAGEAALRASSQLVTTYIAMQGAVPSHAYDQTAPVRSLGIFDSGTPNCYSNYYTPGSPCYFNTSAGAGTYINFFNTNDYALDKWTIDQNYKPDNGVNYPGYYYSSSPGFYRINGSVETDLSFPGNTYEIFAYADEARCYALGAQQGIHGAFGGRQLDLQTIWPPDTHLQPNGIYSAHVWHSGQFRDDFPHQANFWNNILDDIGFNLK
jgi:pimeloyl-ACP methyl ester carboxylesterase